MLFYNRAHPIELFDDLERRRSRIRVQEFQ